VELYNLYSEEKDPSKIVKVMDNGMDLDSNIKEPANPYLDL